MSLRRGRAIGAGMAVLGALLLSASGAAAKCPGHHNPHGNSEATQYSETVPGPCGDQPIGGNGAGNGGGAGANGSSSGPSSGIPPTAITQLRHMGPAGVEAANLAAATSPLGGNHGKGGQAGGKGSGGAAGANGSGGSSGAASGGTATGTGGDVADPGNPFGALASLITGGSGDGLGPLLPILLVAALLGGLGFLALLRARPQ